MDKFTSNPKWSQCRSKMSIKRDSKHLCEFVPNHHKPRASHKEVDRGLKGMDTNMLEIVIFPTCRCSECIVMIMFVTV
jgi:hypothetical protein